MTTVAYRDGVMAADTARNNDGNKASCVKIHRIKGALIGQSGNACDSFDFKRWWGQGADRVNLPVFRQYGSDDGPDFCVLVAEPGKLTWWGQHFQPMEIIDEFWAIGSGAPAALAAMYMGADAAEAVRIAILVDTQTGGDVQVERLNPVVVEEVADA